MNPLKSVENAIAGLLEGAFGRMFRSEVRPVELARKLAREMDAHREVSLSRTYAPHEYSVWLSPLDRARYEGVEGEVIDELCAHLLEHARQEGLVLATAPKISIHTDEGLALGEFGIAAELKRPPDRPDAPAGASSGRAFRAAPASRAAQAFGAAPASRAAQASGAAPAPAVLPPRGGSPALPGPPAAGETEVWSSSARLREPVAAARARRATAALVRADGAREPLAGRGATIGRSRSCEIVVDDPGVSRRHARMRLGPDGWSVEDLRSTNGVSVNGEPLAGTRVLTDGDEIELGATALRFEQP